MICCIWNGDGTNLPAKMAVEYLRGLCQADNLARGLFPVFGEPVRLADITVPICAIACETDHIAAWKGSFNGIRQFGSKNKTFILSRVRSHRGYREPTNQDEIRALHQRRPDDDARGLSRNGRPIIRDHGGHGGANGWRSNLVSKFLRAIQVIRQTKFCARHRELTLRQLQVLDHTSDILRCGNFVSTKYAAVQNTP